MTLWGRRGEHPVNTSFAGIQHWRAASPPPTVYQDLNASAACCWTTLPRLTKS